jgi:hypothetical protein
MSLDIKNLSHVEQDVGKTIKSTKKHFIWEFLLDGKPHKLELYDSRLSGKKKLIKDGQVWKEVQEDVAFSKSFEIGKHSCTIIQHGDKYELRVDNQSFGHLMDLEKNRVYFSGDANPTSMTYTAKAQNNTNKVGFGMGQMNFKAESAGQKPNGLFNFAIKPQNNAGNNAGSINKKRFSEMPSNDSVTVSSKSGNGASLIDFGGDLLSSNSGNTNGNNMGNSLGNPLESKSNSAGTAINIFDAIDFNATAPVNVGSISAISTSINHGNNNEVFNLIGGGMNLSGNGNSSISGNSGVNPLNGSGGNNLIGGGFNNGFNNGLNNGFNNSVNNGFNNGFNNDFNSGFNNNVNNGFNNGPSSGIGNGFNVNSMSSVNYNANANHNFSNSANNFNNGNVMQSSVSSGNDFFGIGNSNNNGFNTSSGNMSYPGFNSVYNNSANNGFGVNNNNNNMNMNINSSNSGSNNFNNNYNMSMPQQATGKKDPLEDLFG